MTLCIRQLWEVSEKENSMNKRIAKKNLKRAFKEMESSRGNGVSVIIKTQAYVDENGKECDPLETPNARFIQLKRPKIQYIRNTEK